MKLNVEQIDRTCPESEIFESVLSLDHKKILELGCGDASITRQIARAGNGRTIIATEVDTIQHQKNLLIDDLPNVDFILSGSEKIPVEDNSFDIILMFKSFHHVPLELMQQSLFEIKRVLKPGGLVYISEPVFDGEFNDILRLFHDEKVVRQAAFNTVKKMVDDKVYELSEELFFYTPVLFENFDQYAEKVIGATHSDHQLSDELYRTVKQKFDTAYENNQGNFAIPIRVDLLQLI